MNFSLMCAAWMACQVGLELVSGQVQQAILVCLDGDAEERFFVALLPHGDPRQETDA
jgi:hypothetical protein